MDGAEAENLPRSCSAPSPASMLWYPYTCPKPPPGMHKILKWVSKKYQVGVKRTSEQRGSTVAWRKKSTGDALTFGACTSAVSKKLTPPSRSAEYAAPKSVAVYRFPNPEAGSPHCKVPIPSADTLRSVRPRGTRSGGDGGWGDDVWAMQVIGCNECFLVAGQARSFIPSIVSICSRISFFVISLHTVLRCVLTELHYVAMVGKWGMRMEVNAWRYIIFLEKQVSSMQCDGSMPASA